MRQEESVERGAGFYLISCRLASQHGVMPLTSCTQSSFLRNVSNSDKPLCSPKDSTLHALSLKFENNRGACPSLSNACKVFIRTHFTPFDDDDEEDLGWHLPAAPQQLHRVSSRPFSTKCQLWRWRGKRFCASHNGEFCYVWSPKDSSYATCSIDL